jgi:competence protein ComEC
VLRLAVPLDVLGGARGQLFPWAPVLLSVGIGIYFQLPVEPALPMLVVCLAVTGLFGLIRVLAAERWHAPALTIALIAGGLVLAAARAHLVAAPVLPFRYYGPVEGRIVEIDRSFSDAIRLTLDHVVLSDVDPAITPARVRVALHGDIPGTTPEPGATVILTGHLAPPEGPVAPGGFDFQRIAWFSSLGAVGYTHSPVMLLEPAHPRSPGMIAFQARMALSRAMQAGMQGQAGALASAFMTGDRSGVSKATNDIMRASNLSHMISISGLHMGLVVGFIFALVRYGLALVPPVALRLNTKKVAACVALVAATGYLALAGPDVATRRAWIMAVVMLIAVLSDRRAISMRSLSIAAMIVLVMEPESLVEPGFQMSFGATAALIAFFGPWSRVQQHLHPLVRPVLLLVLSSAVAGLATGPIAAAHFNRIAGYGLLANFLAGPIMGVIVMPAGVIAVLLTPLGLAGPALWLTQKGTEAILVIAAWVAGFDGSVGAVPTPPGLVLPVFAIGGAFLFLSRGWLRGAGGATIAASFALWSLAERPALLVSGDGALVGLMTRDGRAVSKAKGAGFVAQNWLEDDGDLTSQDASFARGAFTGGKGAMRADFGDHAIWHLTGKTAAERAPGLCRSGVVIVVAGDWTGGGDVPCLVLDTAKLRGTGAVAIEALSGELLLRTAKAVAGDRLWNRPTSRSTRTDSPVKTAAKG